MNNQPGMTLSCFTEDYKSTPSWDIGRPQKKFIEAFEQSLPQSPIIEVGCGTGVLSNYLSELGCDITGIDFAEQAIVLAKESADDRGLNTKFITLDAFQIDSLGKTYNTLIDCCFFHMLDDVSRIKYAQLLSTVVRQNGTVYLLNLAEDLKRPNCPRAVSRQDIETTFRKGWQIQAIEESTIALRNSDDSYKGIYSVIRKV